MEQINKANERKCYDFYFATSRTPDYEKGRPIVSGWWYDSLDDAKTTAHGILAGLCTIGGYKHGRVNIYEGETIAARVSW